MNTQISRRNFLSGTAGLTFAFAIGGKPDTLEFIGDASAQAAYSPTVWVTIANGRHHYHRVARRRDGAGHDDDAAGHHCRRARRRLVQGARGSAVGVGGKEIRQSELQRRISNLGQCVGAGLFQAVADRRRAGASRAARRRGGALERAGRRACDRTERGRARGVGQAHHLWRSRRLCQTAGRAAADRRTRTSSRPASFRYIGQAMFRASNCRQRSPAQPSTQWTRRCRACSTRPCCNRRIRAVRRRR